MASALVVVGLMAGRMPVGVMGTLVRALPAERLLVEHLAPGVSWLPDVLDVLDVPDVPDVPERSGRGGGRR
ncbi:hypothetical protein [Streptomyces sp. FH025]|uniref:hypothetical protein n=1 Tax=Streptomyces sp. FH025 TaxID=2815937 RepID=UPI001A9E719E|nr:hypothetical protein [Streptomyces sp. FH025]MBO1415447.1 hypothetical protein [Streptomyces sp. FH025]